MNLLPLWLNRGVAILTFTLAAGMVSIHVLVDAVTASTTSLPPRTKVVAPLLVGGFLAAWLALALTLGDGQNFPLPNEELLRRPLSALVSFGPMLVALVAFYRSRTLRIINEATPSPWLIRMQMYRMAGITFLIPMLALGVLPAGFAIPAGIGDFLTGAMAPFVASAVAKKLPGSTARAVAWNIFGITDLVVAPVAAVLSHAPVLNMYPLALIPLFLGPPVGILTHIASLRNLAHAARRDVGDVPRHLEEATA